MSLYSDLTALHDPVANWRLSEDSGYFQSSTDFYAGLQPLGAVDRAAPGLIKKDPDKAVRLNGIDAYLEHPNVPELNPLTFTYELWTVMDGVTVAQPNLLAARSTGSQPNGFIFYVGDGATRWMARMHSAGFAVRELSQGPAIVLGKPYHLVATYQDPIFSLYVDGALIATRNDCAGYIPTQRVLRIGSDSAAIRNFYDGTVDEVAIYGYAMTAQRVAQRYQAGRGQLIRRLTEAGVTYPRRHVKVA